MNDFIYIRETSRSSNLLECIFNISMVRHFIVHLSFEKSREQSLDNKLLLHFDFILIFIFISSHFSNFLLSSYSFHSSLECLFFISNRLLETDYCLLSFSLIHFNFHHNLIQSIFGLNSILFSPSLFISFFVKDIIL